MLPIDPSVLADDPLLHRVWQQMGSPPSCRAVGGYVRDRLLGRVTNDLDLAIEADVDDAAAPARRLAAAQGVRAHLLGSGSHRIWRIDGPQLRTEISPLGQLAFADDMQRRDFTVNALAWQLPAGPLSDICGGLEDIQRQTLRAVTRKNLLDDPVRLLRAPRFLAQLTDFQLEPHTRTWIRELAPLVADAPRERVGLELWSLVNAAAAGRGLRECLDLDLVEPAAPQGARIAGDWLKNHLGALARPAGDAVGTVRLALLIKAWGTPSANLLRQYAWPRDARDIAVRAARLVDEALALVDGAAIDRRELIWRAGRAFPVLLAFASALAPDSPGWKNWRRMWQRSAGDLVDPKPLLTGGEISELAGIAPGPELGRVVRDLLRAQVRAEFRTRNGARRWLARRNRH